MKIIQFAYEGLGQSFDDRTNMIIYTGTHDNETITAWYGGLSLKDKRKSTVYLKNLGIVDKKVNHRFIRFCMSSIADFAIVPMWDILGLDTTCRFNTPSTIGGSNWLYRTVDFKKFKTILNELFLVIKEYAKKVI